MGSGMHWRGGRIPYEIGANFTREQVVQLHEGFDWYNRNTCIRWVPKTAEDVNYVWIRKGNACSSYVGNIKNGKQALTLHDGCFPGRAHYHEMMHAIGFAHEHQRH